MLKGFILAIIFGSIVGFGVSNILVTVNPQKIITGIPTPTPISTSNSIVTTPVISTPSLTIEYPQNESIVETANITLKGNTAGSSFVLISTANDSYQTVADNSGSFLVNLSLNLGVNLLNIKSISPDDIENSLELLVTYSTAKLE